MSEPVWDLDRAVKPIDSWWTVGFVDPIAMRVLPVLLRIRRATPNAVTGVAFVVGLVSILLFATGHFLAGAVFYEARFVLDCLDGKIARVKRLSSSAGAMFDRVADLLTIPAVYATIGWWLAARDHLPARLALLPACGALLVAAVEAVLEVARLHRGVAAPAPAGEPAPPASGIAAWARRHRLTLRPWTVEAETLGLFLGPIVLRGDALGGLELALAAVYALFVVVDLAFLARVVTTES